MHKPTHTKLTLTNIRQNWRVKVGVLLASSGVLAALLGQGVIITGPH